MTYGEPVGPHTVSVAICVGAVVGPAVFTTLTFGAGFTAAGGAGGSANVTPAPSNGNGRTAAPTWTTTVATTAIATREHQRPRASRITEKPPTRRIATTPPRPL